MLKKNRFNEFFYRLLLKQYGAKNWRENWRLRMLSSRLPFGDRVLGFLDILLFLGQTYICCCKVLRLLVCRGQFLAVRTFFLVSVKQRVRHFDKSPPF